MNPITLFRASVIAAPVIAVLAFAYTLAAPSSFSQDWQDILAWSGNGSILSKGEEIVTTDIVIMILGVILLIVAVGNQIALFFYWKPSRLLFFILTILGFVVTPFLGLTVSPPLETLGYELAAFISGITLAMAYFSPVSEKFK